MKVVVAGLPKTGTTSMKEALKILDVKNVHHYFENCCVAQDQWTNILRGRWCPEDFKRLFHDVDAVIDEPACFLWEEISLAFPDAKIVLTIRENDEVWFESLKQHYKKEECLYEDYLVKYLSLTGWRKYRNIRLPMDRIFYGVSKMTTQTIAENKSNLKLKYRAHNNYVLQAAPKDKLLVFKCSDGWLPLCNFLNLPVPNVPFPHGNKGGGSYIDRESHPQAVKMRHEVYHSIAAIFSISLGMFLYLLW